jgi:hypothetical protein
LIRKKKKTSHTIKAKEEQRVQRRQSVTAVSPLVKGRELKLQFPWEL